MANNDDDFKAKLEQLMGRDVYNCYKELAFYLYGNGCAGGFSTCIHSVLNIFLSWFYDHNAPVKDYTLMWTHAGNPNPPVQRRDYFGKEHTLKVPVKGKNAEALESLFQSEGDCPSERQNYLAIKEMFIDNDDVFYAEWLGQDPHVAQVGVMLAGRMHDVDISHHLRCNLYPIWKSKVDTIERKLFLNHPKCEQQELVYARGRNTGLKLRGMELYGMCSE